MPQLIFHVKADYDKVIRLREEINKLKADMSSMNAIANPTAFNELNAKAQKATHELNTLTDKAAHAGAEFQNNLKKKIFDASQVVNTFSEEIIKQRKGIGEIKTEIRQLSEQYRSLNRSEAASSDISDKLRRAKAVLGEKQDALFKLTQEQANARLSVKKLRDEYALFKKEGADTTASIKGMVGNFKNLSLSILGGIGLKELAGKIISIRAEFESLETSLKVLLGGSQERLNNIMGQIKEYALASPLNTKDMVGAIQMMTSFGIEAEKSIDYLKSMGDISMGNTGKFNSLALAFSQMSAAGKLMGQDLNQMINAGFNPLEEISRKTGKSIGELKEQMSKGAITSKMVQDAFISATSAGGKFYGMSAEGAKILNGQISMLQEGFDNMFNEIGAKGEGVAMTAVQTATKLVENYEQVGKILAGLVVTYGTYKTALILSTQVTNGMTMAQVLHTTTTKVLTAAQALLNATILANPYVLAAVALGTLITAVILAGDSMTAAERAQDNYNKKIEENSKLVKDEKAEIDKLIGTLEDETSSIESKNIAFSTLITKYPTIFGKYKTEKDLIDHITEARQRENAEIERKAALLGQKAYNESKKRATELNRLKYLQENGDIRGRQTQSGYKKGKDHDEYLRLWYTYRDDIKKTQTWYGSPSSAIDRLASVATEEYKLNINENRKSQIAKYNANVGNLSKEQAQKELAKLRSGLKLMDKSGKNYFKIGNNEPLSRVQIKERIALLENNVKTERKTMAQWRKEAEKETKKNRKAAKDLASSTELLTKDQAEKKMKAANDMLATSEKSEKNFDIQDKSGAKAVAKAERERKQQIKDANAHQKARNDLDSKKIAKSQAQIELENQVEQARIDALTEGSEKTLAAMKLAHKKELEQIDKEKEEYLKKKQDLAEAEFKADPKNKDKAFNRSSVKLSEDEEEQFNKIKENVGRKHLNEKQSLLDEEVKAMNDFIQKYGTVQQQRISLEKSYYQQIEEAYKAHDTWKAASLQSELDEKLKELDFTLFKDSINWDAIFTSLESQSKGYLEELRKKLQELLSSGSLDVADMNVVAEKIRDINTAIDNENSRWGIANDALSKHKRLIQEAADAMKLLGIAREKSAGANLNLYSTQQNIQDTLKESGVNVSIKDISSQNKNGLLSKLNHEDKNLTKLNKLFAELAKNEIEAAKATEGLSKAVSKSEQANDAASLSIHERAEIIADGLNGVLDNIRDLPNLLDEIGLGNTAVGKFAKNGVNALGAAANAATDLATGNYIGAALNGLTAVKSLGKAFGIGVSNHDKQVKIQEEISKKIDIINSGIDKMVDTLSKSYGVNAINVKNELDKSISKTQKQYWEGLYAAGADDYGGRHTDWFHWEKNSGGMARAIAREYNISGVRGWVTLFSKLSSMKDGGGAKILNDIRANHSLDWWYTMQTQGYNEGAMGKWLTQWADSWDKIVSSSEKLKEQLTTTTKDNVFDSFLGSLYDLSDGSENVFENISDNWQKMVNKMVVNNIVGTKFQEKLSKWYEDLSEINKKRVNGNIGNAKYQQQIERLKADYDKYIKDAKNEIDSLRNIGIVQEVGDNKKQQGGSSRGFETMTQDQAGELNGRFTLTNELLTQIKDQKIKVFDIVSDTRNIIAQSYLELVQIRDNTKAVIKPINEMRADIEKIKNNTSRL